MIIMKDKDASHRTPIHHSIHYKTDISMLKSLLVFAFLKEVSGILFDILIKVRVN